MRRHALPLLSALSLLACDDERLYRHLPLTAMAALPQADCTLADGNVIIATPSLELLIADAHYVAWAQSDAATYLLGKLDLADSHTILPWTLSGLDEKATAVLVTEESGALLPDAPSRWLRLSGLLGGALTYAPLSAGTASAVAGSAEIFDDTLTVTLTTLPTLPTGLALGVWARWGALAGAVEPEAADSHTGHGALTDDQQDLGLKGGDHAATTLPASGGPSVGTPASGDLLLVGTLDAQGHLTAAVERDLASVREILITVESQRGRPDVMAPVSVARGTLTLPTLSESTADHSH